MLTRRELANAIRALSMDAVQQANSGHPGAPMGMADIAEVLWRDYLQFNPSDPQWINRDRFVLSNGHGSMLLYSLLHLTGYDLSIEDLRNFRQLHSKTPGHPEFGCTPGVETTTGPLGQGLANAVGMAIAEKALAARFNRPGYELIDHHTYVFAGDGCLMEGISHEAASLAGTLGLGKLIGFYDDNGISIDGEVAGWFTEDTAKRFQAYGWQVIDNVDGHSSEAVNKAIVTARAEHSRPTLICCKTIIGYGAPSKQGTEDCHGAALGMDEVAATRAALQWDHDPFVIPEEFYQQWSCKEKGQHLQAGWQKMFDAYTLEYPGLGAELKRRCVGKLPADFAAVADQFVGSCQAKSEKIASRKASQNALNAFAPILPELMGGSADLTGSNLTQWQGCENFTKDNANGNYLFYGVREFGMVAINNGIALHGGFIPYAATFLVFMDYCRNAMRMAALMKQRSIFVFTHDSIGLGEDGPTHQPVEQLTNLRSTPNMSTWRPCDAVESAVAWQAALERDNGPSALVFSRQGLLPQQRDPAQVNNIAKGGYILRDCAGEPQLILLATGSEVTPVMAAAQTLAAQHYRVRVVSMPSTDVFDQQDQSYRESVLPAAVTARLAVEAAHADYWFKYVGLKGEVLGLSGFGESAPAEVLFQEFGFTADNIFDIARRLLDSP